MNRKSLTTPKKEIDTLQEVIEIVSNNDKHKAIEILQSRILIQSILEDRL